MFGCQSLGNRYNRDINGTIQIPLGDYKLSQKKNCKYFAKKYIEINRNRYTNEDELLSFYRFNDDGTFKLNFLKKDGTQKFKSEGYTPGMYCIENDKIYIEIFYPTYAGSHFYSSIVHEGQIDENLIKLSEFKDIVTLIEK